MNRGAILGLDMTTATTRLRRVQIIAAALIGVILCAAFPCRSRQGSAHHLRRSELGPRAIFARIRDHLRFFMLLVVAAGWIVAAISFVVGSSISILSGGRSAEC